MDKHTLYALAARLGADSHGVVTAAELRGAGADPDAVAAALEREWQRTPLRGVYIIDDRPITDVVKGHAAVKHAGPDAVVTGLLACHWYELRWVPESEAVQVLVEPERRRRGSEGWVLVRRFCDINRLATIEYEGLLLAPIAQSVVDGSRELSELQDVRGLVLGAVADGRCTAKELLAILDAGAVAGTALARRACRDAERGATSPPEAELVDVLLGYGVPFYCNVEVWVNGEFLGVADVWLVGTGVGGEQDSREHHGDSDKLDSTLLRDKRFTRAGAVLAHVTPTRFRLAPDAFVWEMFHEVLNRQAKGLGDPPGLELRPRGPLLQGNVRTPPPYPFAQPSVDPTQPPVDPRNEHGQKFGNLTLAGSVDQERGVRGNRVREGGGLTWADEAAGAGAGA